jgi:hypothetical protein
MEHFIIIRFSVIFKNSPEFEAKKNLLFDEKRLDFRFYLFENFCFPCLINQTLKDFKVIILYDELLPENYLNRLKEIIKNQENFYLHLWNLQDNLSSNSWLIPYMKENNPEKYIITTRLDDDDMINFKTNEKFKKYIKRFNCIEKVCSLKGGFFLNYFNNDKKILFKVNYESLSVFMSKIHKITQSNVYGHSHENHNLPKRVINFKNSFIMINHMYENDNRLLRFSKKQGILVTENQLINYLKE